MKMAASISLLFIIEMQTEILADPLPLRTAEAHHGIASLRLLGRHSALTAELDLHLQFRSLHLLAGDSCVMARDLAFPAHGRLTALGVKFGLLAEHRELQDTATLDVLDEREEFFKIFEIVSLLFQDLQEGVQNRNSRALAHGKARPVCGKNLEILGDPQFVQHIFPLALLSLANKERVWIVALRASHSEHGLCCFVV